MKVAHPPTSIEQALAQLDQAHDSLLGNLGECLSTLHSTLARDAEDGLCLPGSAPAHSGTPWGVKASQGQRPNMEDAYSVQMAEMAVPAPVQTVPSPAAAPPVATPTGPDTSGDSSLSAGVGDDDTLIPWTEDLAVLSVFDGHGGQEVAMHCRDRLHRHFAANLSSLRPSCTSGNLDTGIQPADGSADEPCGLLPASADDALVSSVAYNPDLVLDALRTAFQKTDEELAGTEAGDFVGATAVVAVVGRQHIWIAHCGDSRAVLQRNGDAHALTRDHKPDREDEAARIKSAGGRIVFTSGSHRVMGMLAMSRAIGDHFLRPYVIAEPEVACFERTMHDEVLVLATDGLWDVFSCKEATTLAQRCITRSKERGMSRHGACRVAASVLTKVALERGSRDNITVIVVDVTMPTSPHGPSPSASAPHHGLSAPASSAGAAPDMGTPPLPHKTGASVGGGHPPTARTSAAKGEAAHDGEPCAHSVAGGERSSKPKLSHGTGAGTGSGAAGQQGAGSAGGTTAGHPNPTATPPRAPGHGGTGAGPPSLARISAKAVVSGSGGGGGGGGGSGGLPSHPASATTNTTNAGHPSDTGAAEVAGGRNGERIASKPSVGAHGSGSGGAPSGASQQGAGTPSRPSNGTQDLQRVGTRAQSFSVSTCTWLKSQPAGHKEGPTQAAGQPAAGELPKEGEASHKSAGPPGLGRQKSAPQISAGGGQPTAPLPAGAAPPAPPPSDLAAPSSAAAQQEPSSSTGGASLSPYTAYSSMPNLVGMSDVASGVPAGPWSAQAAVDQPSVSAPPTAGSTAAPGSVLSPKAGASQGARGLRVSMTGSGGESLLAGSIGLQGHGTGALSSVAVRAVSAGRPSSGASSPRGQSLPPLSPTTPGHGSHMAKGSAETGPPALSTASGVRKVKIAVQRRSSAGGGPSDSAVPSTAVPAAPAGSVSPQ